MIWLGWDLWHINYCRLFNAKSSLYIYIKYVWLVGLGWVGFYGISTIVGFLMPNPVPTYILTVYIICKGILWITFLNEPEVFFFNGFKYCYIIVTISLYTVCSIWTIHKMLLGATTPRQSGLESNGNEGVLHKIDHTYISI